MASTPAPLPTDNTYVLPAGLSPDSIDVCSELATIFSRVRYTDKTGQPANTTTGNASNGTDGTVPQLPTITATSPAGAVAGASAAAAAAGGGGGGGAAVAAASSPGGNGEVAPLSTKDIPAATDHLKHKIQRARAAVHTLPDIQRTIPEQEAEIAELVDKIARQRAVLLQLKESGLQFAAENSRKADGDVEMGGTGLQGTGSSG